MHKDSKKKKKIKIEGLPEGIEKGDPEEYLKQVFHSSMAENRGISPFIDRTHKALYSLPNLYQETVRNNTIIPNSKLLSL